MYIYWTDLLHKRSHFCSIRIFSCYLCKS